MSRVSSLIITLFFITLASMTLHRALNWLVNVKGPGTFSEATPTFVLAGVAVILALLLFLHERGPAAGRLFARFNRVFLAAAIICYGIIIGITAFSVIKAT